MGFTTLGVDGDMALLMSSTPEVNQKIRIRDVEWIGFIDGIGYLNVQTQFGWMSFTNVEIEDRKGDDRPANGFDGKTFTYQNKEVSVSSTYFSSTLVARGTIDDPIARITTGNFDLVDVPDPTIEEGLSKSFVELLDPNGMHNLRGSFYDDELRAGPSGSFLNGNNGDDRLIGGAQKDIIDGGEGIDTIFGGDGDDEIRGGPGKDIIDGGPGDDTIYPDSGGDVQIKGGADNDQIFGADEGERLFGGDGEDFIFGFTGEDILFGGNDSDRLVGWRDKDKLNGGRGNDFLYAGTETLLFDADEIHGGDVLVGGAGRDTLHSMNATLRGDKLKGGAGIDTFYVGARDTVQDLQRGEDVFFASQNDFDYVRIRDVKGGVDVSFVKQTKSSFWEVSDSVKLKGDILPQELGVTLAPSQSGAFATLNIARTDTFSREAKKELGQTFVPLAKRLAEVAAEEKAGGIRKNAIEQAIETVLTNVKLPGAAKVLTKVGAKAVVGVVGELAGFVKDYVDGEFDGFSNGKLALAAAAAVGTALLPVLIPAGVGLFVVSGAIAVSPFVIKSIISDYEETAAQELRDVLRDGIIIKKRPASEEVDTTIDVVPILPQDDWLGA